MTLPDRGAWPGGEPRSWLPPPERPSLLPHEVHLWLADLDSPQRDGLASTLAEVERMRARRFRAPQDRARFTARRSILRDILGRYARLPPQALEFASGSYGKPFLIGRAAALTFSASYSHALALYAVGVARPLGVDLERVRSDLPVDELGACAFTAAERAAFGAPPGDARPATFFRAWTRKEALLKGRGTGFLASPGDDVTPHGWSFYDLAPAPGYVAALVTEGASATLKGWCWRG